MNPLKNRLQIAAAVLLLLVIAFMVWYVLFYIPNPDMGPDGTFVSKPTGKLVNL